MDNLHLVRYQGSGSVPQDIEPFIIAPQRPAHPVTVDHWNRITRDLRAIPWLVGQLTEGLTEDAEMESFAATISGSFNTE
jgi:hypothetical protein